MAKMRKYAEINGKYECMIHCDFYGPAGRQAGECVTCPVNLGVQEPPQDYRIYNRRMPDGTFRPIAGFFDRDED